MCHIDDMLCVNSDEFLNILLAEFFRFLRKLKEFNFFVRTNENTKVLIYTDGQNLDEALLRPQNWYFFRGDNDV